MAKLKSELKKWPMGKPDNYNEEEEAELKKERMAKQEEEIEARTEQLKDEYSKKLYYRLFNVTSWKCFKGERI